MFDHNCKGVVMMVIRVVIANNNAGKKTSL